MYTIYRVTLFVDIAFSVYLPSIQLVFIPIGWTGLHVPLVLQCKLRYLGYKYQVIGGLENVNVCQGLCKKYDTLYRRTLTCDETLN